MTIEERQMFTEGREMVQAWRSMKKQGDSRFFPTQEDIKNLARQLDLSVSFVSKRVWTFLGN